MAYYPKYNKNKKVPKAWVGTALALAPFALEAGKGLYNMFQGGKRKRDAIDDIDALKESGRLTYKVPKTYQQMVDEPIDQGYIESLQGDQASDRASAMGILAKDPRNALAGVNLLQDKASKSNLDLLKLQSDAKTEALKRLSTEESVAEGKDVKLAASEATGLQAELQSASTQQTSGVEGIASNIVSGLQTGYNQGLFSEGNVPENTIDIYGDDQVQEIEDVANANQSGVGFEEGGTTPDEFSHETNPIDIVQGGEKIGEMTGDEIIMPPDDRAQIEDLMAKGGGEELVALLQELFSKYDSNVIDGKDQEAPTEEEVPIQEEQEQAPVMNKGGYLAKIKNRLKINF